VIENLPLYINLVFILTTLATAYLFYKASGNSKLCLTVMLAWLLLQALISLSGFYTFTNSFPPRFMLLTFPPLLLIVIIFLSSKGKIFTDSLNIKTLTYLQTVRVPVELVLFRLFLYKEVPELMTFEGRNFDILAGLTAPFIAYFGFTKKIFSTKIILTWNIICLILLLNIVINAILSAPFPFQQFAFEQPNIAVFYFPFVWLPGFIVPVVLFSHLVSIRQLSMKTENSEKR
jgi:hypothetical protein